MRNLIYYPYIDIPKSDWTIRTLIYHDNVGCIVPNAYFYEPERYEPYMRELVQHQLVIPVNPMEILERPFESLNPFLRYIESESVNIYKRRKRFLKNADENLIHEDKLRAKKYRIHSEKLKVTGSKIHSDKLDSEILYSLEQIGLAKTSDDGWYSVEKKTAKELMIFLASVISNKMDYIPTTDKYQKRFSIANKSKKVFKTTRKNQRKREVILENLIPRPQEMNISQLLNFKEKHNSLLIQFRNRIEALVFDKDLEEDSLRFKETMVELNDRKEELSARMNEGKYGRIIFGTLFGLIGAAQGMVAADTIGAIIGGIPGFGNAVHEAITLENPEKMIDYSGMKYLALIDNKIRKMPTHNNR